MIEIISRALILKDNKLLLCKALKGGHYYLPGGHVEFGENAIEALQREMVEECGTNINNIHFIGVFENKWGEPLHHEYNLLYTADIDSVDVVSKEEHIAFEWVVVSKLSEITFYPKEFLDRIAEWCEDKKNIYFSTILKGD
ncbi:MAG: NUDIX domain-containing protein [Candidatus Pacebacteria bacterium]|nr:NUDIX domain-containing protein [Candidatus Paceibacterota bacterium]